MDTSHLQVSRVNRTNNCQPKPARPYSEQVTVKSLLAARKRRNRWNRFKAVCFQGWISLVVINLLLMFLGSLCITSGSLGFHTNKESLVYHSIDSITTTPVHGDIDPAVSDFLTIPLRLAEDRMILYAQQLIAKQAADLNQTAWPARLAQIEETTSGLHEPLDEHINMVCLVRDSILLQSRNFQAMANRQFDIKLRAKQHWAWRIVGYFWGQETLRLLNREVNWIWMTSSSPSLLADAIGYAQQILPSPEPDALQIYAELRHMFRTWMKASTKSLDGLKKSEFVSNKYPQLLNQSNVLLSQLVEGLPAETRQLDRAIAKRNSPYWSLFDSSAASMRRVFPNMRLPLGFGNMTYHLQTRERITKAANDSVNFLKAMDDTMKLMHNRLSQLSAGIERLNADQWYYGDDMYVWDPTSYDGGPVHISRRWATSKKSTARTSGDRNIDHFIDTLGDYVTLVSGMGSQTDGGSITSLIKQKGVEEQKFRDLKGKSMILPRKKVTPKKVWQDNFGKQLKGVLAEG